MKVLIKNISCLIQTEDIPRIRVEGKDMAKLPVVNNAFLEITEELITDFGEMKDLDGDNKYELIIDASGKFVFPSFCDSHTHLVYAGSREKEFVDKIRGLSYEEIARRGGGILNSSKLLHNTAENELFEQSMNRINEIIHFGTGAVEIKSGYGLNVEDELKMLRVIKRIK
jgi:imidazolonepropionase